MNNLVGQMFSSANKRHVARHGAGALALLAILLSGGRLRAQCDLQITSAGPSLANAKQAFGTPNVGDSYSLRVNFRVVGTPTNTFRIKFQLANTTRYINDVTGHAGWSYWYFWDWGTFALDDTIPWSITLDPDGVSGDTNLANNVASGTFTPIPPGTAVEFYSPRIMSGFESSVLNFQPGSGTIRWIHVVAGVPTSHGAQSVLSVVGSTNSTVVLTPPYGTPLFEVDRTNIPAGPIQIGKSFAVQLSRVRVNPTVLRTVTWADMAGLSTDWTQWLAPDTQCESTNALIVSFVQQSLPANYRNTLTPYDTARTLHRAVMKALTYQENSHGDAVGSLTNGIADCSGFSALLTASLRNVGIPARRIEGFNQGTTNWHFRVEFHLPGCEWLVADPTFGNGTDQTGTYAYDFGYVPSGNSFIAMDVGDVHKMSYTTFSGIQTYGWWWSSGGATHTTNSTVAYLQPASTMCVPSVAGGSIQLCLTNAPSQGTVVLESSTNLISWSPVATNSANGNSMNYSFAITNSPKAFFRAILGP